MMRSIRHSTIVLFFLALSLVGASQAAAATQVETVGNPPNPLPVARWISEIDFPTPDVKIRVNYEDCPGWGKPLACAGALNQGAYDITITDRRKEFPNAYLRSTIHHEVGHVVESAYFGEQTERDFALRMGYPADRTWFGDLDVGTPAEPSRIEPAEWFAEVYSLCAWGPDRPDGLTAYGFDYSYRQVLPLCHQIQLQMTGEPMVMPPAPIVPVACSPRCQVRLGVNDRFVAKERLVPGTVSAVVRCGRKVPMLERGCKRNVLVAGGVVQLNWCPGVVRPTT